MIERHSQGRAPTQHTEQHALGLITAEALDGLQEVFSLINDALEVLEYTAYLALALCEALERA